MHKAYIMPNGKVISLPVSRFTNPGFNINGQLIGFDRIDDGNPIPIRYNYFNGEVFYQGEQKNVLFEGFYNKNEYYIFMNEWLNSDYKLTDPSKNELYFSHYYSVNRLSEFFPPSTDETVNTFILSDDFVDALIMFTNIKFPFPPGNPNNFDFSLGKSSFPINHPNYSEIYNGFDWSHELQGLLKNDIYKFFFQNFKKHLTQSEINNPSKIVRLNYRITIKICLEIQSILNNVIKDFLPSQFTFVANALPQQLLSGKALNWSSSIFLPEYYYMYEIIYQLFKSWGFYQSENSPYTPMFNEVNDLDNRQSYLDSLLRFTNVWKFNSQLIAQASPDNKISLFFEICPPDVLKLINSDVRHNIFHLLIKAKWKVIGRSSRTPRGKGTTYYTNIYDRQDMPLIVFASNKKAFVNLIYSFDGTDSNKLLDFLNSEIAPGEKTKFFQVLYNKLKDDQGFFGSQMTDKGNVMTHLMYLWMVSNYNPFFVNLFADTTLQETIDLNNNLTETRTPVVLNYKSMSIGFLKFNNINFHFENGQIRPIETVETVSYKLQPTGEGPWEQVPILNKSEYKLNLLSIFQPISLTDFDQNSHAVKVQMINLGVFGYEQHDKTALVPAFFLKYMDDYEDVESYWNQVSLTVDIVLTFVGFYGLTYLRHLRHVGKLGKLLRAHKIGPAALDAINMVEVIATLKIGANVIEITASTAHLILRFTTDNCSDFQNDMVSWINVQANNQSSSNNIQLNDLEDSPIPSNQLMTYELCRELDKILSIIALSAAFADISLGIALNNRIKYIKDNNLIPDELVLISSEFYNPDIAAISAELGMIDDIFANLFTNFENLFSNVNNVAKRNELLGILNAPPFNNTKRIAFVEDLTPIFQKYHGKPNELLDVLAKNNFKIVENWKLLEGYASLSKYRRMQKVLESSLLTDRLIDGSSYQGVLTRMSKYPDLEQLDFLSNFNPSIYQYIHLEANLEKLDLCFDLKTFKLFDSAKDTLKIEDIELLISSNLTNKHIGVIRWAKLQSWMDVHKNYPKFIDFKPISKANLQNLYDINLGLSNTKYTKLQQKNRIFCTTEVYNGNAMVGTPIHEVFISGKQNAVSDILNTSSGSINSAVINNQNYNIVHQGFNFQDYEKFSHKAFEKLGRPRVDDTELKYVFNFLETHWNSGNKFKIKIESVLYNCESCQRYMQGLKTYGAKQGKIIEFEFFAHEGALSIPKTLEILNN